MTQTAHIKPNNRTYKKHEALGYSYDELVLIFCNFVGMINPEDIFYFTHSDHLGSSSWITDAPSGNKNNRQGVLRYFIQPPSASDIQNAGHRTNYVFGKASGLVYIYDGDDIKATIPVSCFVIPKN